jgi:hypothetical protein
MGARFFMIGGSRAEQTADPSFYCGGHDGRYTHWHTNGAR